MKIDMTCMELSVEDILGCSLGLTKREVGILLSLLDRGRWLAVHELSRISRRDRSVVQRALLRMVEKGVVVREQRNREGGGYEYLYRAKDKEAVKRAILGKSRSFSAMVAGRLRGW